MPDDRLIYALGESSEHCDIILAYQQWVPHAYHMDIFFQFIKIDMFLMNKH
jgi:hypothetical protein